MAAFATVMRASVTRAQRSVQMANLVNSRLCQELVRSTTHGQSDRSGKLLVMIAVWQPNSSSRPRLMVLS